MISLRKLNMSSSSRFCVSIFVVVDLSLITHSYIYTYVVAAVIETRLSESRSAVGADVSERLARKLESDRSMPLRGRNRKTSSRLDT